MAGGEVVCPMVCGHLPGKDHAFPFAQQPKHR
jgi:hypothetical protein